MHRSGTSMLTGALSICGMYIGKNLLSGARDNPTGHFEDKRFLNINNSILIKNGGSWHTPPDSLAYQGMKGAMLEFLSRPEWDNHEPSGWKDPRTCLTFPLWYNLIHPEEIRVVLIERSRAAIIQSLKKRNGFPEAKSARLAQIHYRRAYENIRKQGVRHFVTHYESLLSKRGGADELESICNFLGLDYPEAESPRRKKLEAFINPKLNHNRRTE